MEILEKVLCRETPQAALSLQLMEKTNRPLCYCANTFREKRPGTKRFFVLQGEYGGTKAGSWRETTQSGKKARACYNKGE